MLSLEAAIGGSAERARNSAILKTASPEILRSKKERFKMATQSAGGVSKAHQDTRMPRSPKETFAANTSTIQVGGARADTTVANKLPADDA